MPINRTYPIDSLISSIKLFSKASSSQNKRVTFEYVMLRGVNDSKHHAVELAKLLKPINSHVNLIHFNPWPGSPFSPSSDQAIESFKNILNNLDIFTTIRRSKGLDILAACGQLKSSHLSKVKKLKL
ncbi:hypothetical protein BB560_001740 [Smittium megazygosporum]|uniref:Radical SAM core domain-containing protein n=1 Tax=Smittium megazygosporum TaxID=133381 RepID=A0A2T9ZGR2_9FUNG|nr:hypothetical protein BB560_001740 [Smittium megazygosporum]